MKRYFIMLGIGVALFSPQARADDTLIEGAKLCTSHLPRYEREYGIPTHLLSAIASTESGRYHEGLKIRVPWPWTINADGKGYIFDSKAKAIAAVRRLKAHGTQSIDVGCMQVNIYHHPGAFASLDEAFEPQKNIAYAAGFLKSLYDEEGSWKKAAADYHSKTPGLGRKYVSEVYNSWYQIIDKLRAARLQVPDSSVQAMNELKGGSPHAPKAAIHHPEKKLGVYHPRMNHIQLTRQDNTGQSNVIVVKPEIKVADNTPVAAPQPQSRPLITVAQAMAVPLTLQETPDVQDARILRVGDQRVIETSDTASRKTGPNFIFND